MSVLNVERPDFMAEEEIRMFEDSVVRFFEQSAPPERVEKWRKDGGDAELTVVVGGAPASTTFRVPIA